MYGAIIGDIVGSRYEYDLSPRVKDFVLFGDNTIFTDDTVLTVGVAEALLDAGKDPEEDTVKDLLKISLRKWGHRYPHAGYGGIFRQWLDGEIDYPYNSFGNGSAMRVSPAGWLYSSLEKTRQVARWTAEITHNHPDAVQGADAVASVIYLARNDAPKREIREYVTREFGYDLSESCEELRTHYRFSERCSLTVPPAIIAFLEGNYFEDVLRNAVSWAEIVIR